jgi:protein ImuA
MEGRVTLGIAEADAWLAGGLRRDALHEAYAEAREDAPSAMALALLVAWLNHAQDRTLNPGAIIWARELAAPSLPYGPGLIELGIDPAIITLLLLPDSRAVLRAALDSVRQGAAGTVLIELRGRQPLLDLTATRRLALAAQESATMVWLVRGEAQPVPSAAQTRWRVAHAPAADFGTRPAFDLTLLRHRGGREGLHIRMEWDRDTASFQSSAPSTSSALSGLVPAVAAGAAGGTAVSGRGDRAA